MKANLVLLKFLCRIQLLLVISFFSTSCVHNIKQNIQATLFWERNVMPIFKADSSENITIHISEVINDSIILPPFDIIRTNSCEAYLDTISNQFFKFSDDSIWMVNMNDCELMTGLSSNSYYEDSYGQFFSSNTVFLQPFLYPKESKLQFQDIRDSIINGQNYKILQRLYKSSFFLNDSTGEFDIPNFHTLYYYYNTNTCVIDRICAIPTSDSPLSSKKDYYLAYSFKDPTLTINHIFNFNNKQYRSYTIHNDEFLPYSTIKTTAIPSVLTEETLSYPIVSLTGDTTTINKETGWILLGFWDFSCPLCYHQLFSDSSKKQELSRKQSIEKNKIKILYINPLSNNQKKLIEFASQHDANNIIYHSKGLNRFLNTDMYYLISPTKEILYTTDNLNKYSEITNKTILWGK